MRETSQEVSPEVWQEWILEAIRKIRSQKQRPSIQRICQAIGSHHKFHEDIVAGKLEEAVKSGAVIKLYNKGLHSYKAPVARKSINVNKDSDLSRLVVKAVRELGECDGSNIKLIESYVQKSNNIVLDADCDFKLIVKHSVRSAVAKEFLVQDGKLYKVGKVSITSPRKRRSTSPRKKAASIGGSTSLAAAGSSASNIGGSYDSIGGSGSGDANNTTNMSTSRAANDTGTSLNVSIPTSFYFNRAFPLPIESIGKFFNPNNNNATNHIYVAWLSREICALNNLST